MDYETFKALTNASGHIEIDINETGVDMKANANNAALMIAIHGLIQAIKKNTGKTEPEILLAVSEFCRTSRVIKAESKEQLDVIKQILKSYRESED